MQSQKEFMKRAAAAGNYCIVCYSAEDAIFILNSYMNNQTIQNLSILKGGNIVSTIK